MLLRPRILVPLLLALAVMASAPAAFARGENYSFEGGTGAQRAQVEKALSASSFDWSVVRSQVTIHIGRNMDSHATPGDVWLDARLLDSGRFSWGVVQHEFAHQVDFLLLTEENRVELQRLLGAKAWCWDTSGFEHADYGCERFASTLAWAYWPSAGNSMKPTSSQDESAAMPPAAFRAALAEALHTGSLKNLRRPA
jgi:hypothetical protein